MSDPDADLPICLPEFGAKNCLRQLLKTGPEIACDLLSLEACGRYVTWVSKATDAQRLHEQIVYKQ
jgi:hypothetical protein